MDWGRGRGVLLGALRPSTPDALARTSGTRVLPTCAPHDRQAVDALAAALLPPGTGGRFAICGVGPHGRGATLSVSLAHAFARAGRSVLLVDADLRRPRVHEVLGFAADPGLTNVLLGVLSADAALVDADGVDVLVAGPAPADPLPLLGTDAARSVFADLGRRHDVTLLLVPAPLDAGEAQPLARLDAPCLLVVEPGVVRRGELRHTAAWLRAAGIRLAGVVPTTPLAPTASD